MSMTLEEAIVQIYGLKKYCEDMADSDESGSYVFDLDVQALDLALFALRPISREQVEKAWRGEWNYSHKTKIDGVDVVQCSNCGQEALTLALYVKNGNFCPYCGAAMTDEAVDILLKRLEALKDGSTTD